MRWNAWRALRERAHIRLEWWLFDEPDGAAEIRSDGTEVVLLDGRLDRVERHAVLAHELIHLERGVPYVGAPVALVEKEEHAVRRETARRLLPPDELRAWCVARAEVEPVTARLVAEEWDVPLRVAEEALSRLRHPTGREH